MTAQETWTGDHPDLVALVRAELSNAEMLAAGDHLEGCEECRRALVEVVVGSALLRRSVRVLEESSPRPRPTLHARAVPPPASLRRRRVPRVALVAAAAVLVGSVGGAGVATALGERRDAPPESAVVDRVVTLEAVGAATYDGPRPAGEVQLGRADGRRTSITVLTHDLPAADADHFYQAWLLEPASNKMLPLGVVSGSRTTFRVGDALLTRYAAIDLSLEADDGDPQHAAASVLRGSYSDTPPG